MNDIIEYILDNRSAKKASYDYRIGKINELKAIEALVDFYIVKGIVTNYQPINSYETWLDGDYHNEPDFYFFKGEDQVFSIEVKFSNTGNFFNDLIYIKPNPFWISQKYPSTYPNFKVLVATSEHFTIIDAKEFTPDKLKIAEEWSNENYQKKVYKFSTKREWFDWVFQIE